MQRRSESERGGDYPGRGYGKPSLDEFREAVKIFYVQCIIIKPNVRKRNYVFITKKKSKIDPNYHKFENLSTTRKFYFDLGPKRKDMRKSLKKNV